MNRAISPMHSLGSDHEVMEELRALAASRKRFPHAESNATSNRAIGELVQAMGEEAYRPGIGDSLAEAIIQRTGRPSLLIQQGKIETPELQVWRKRLEAHVSQLEGQVIPSVGRVELSSHPEFDWIGTGWMVGEDVMMTNRHVAEVFAEKRGGQLVFMKNIFGQTIGARVDFLEEYQSDVAAEVQVEQIVYLSERHQADVAILRLRSGALPPPLKLAARDPIASTPIGVIGYPAQDSQRNPGPSLREIFKDIFDVKRLAPGYVTDVSQGGFLHHDGSTLGGNSGSPVVNLETGEVVGLHFAGKFMVANSAVKASVLRRLVQSVRPVAVGLSGQPAETEGRTRGELEGRGGYDEGFLSSRAEHLVELPRLSTAQMADAIPVKPSGRGLTRFILDYTHFSVVMKKSRRLAYFTAVNIDGTSEVAVRGRPRWIFDPRIDQSLQIGDEVYGGRNKLDRGHLVRRLDPVWGSPAIAKQANDDTHIFTNAAPQQHDYNDGPWGDLEDYLLYSVNNANKKLTIFTGPVFSDSDMKYRGVMIPAEYWKVAVMIGPEEKLHATAYVVSQVPYLDDLEFVPGRFRTYQRSIASIETLTGLNFGSLKEFDPLAGQESVQDGHVISGEEDVQY